MEITKKTIQKQIDFLGNLYCRASDQSHIDKLDELYEVLKYVQDDLVPTIERGKALLCTKNYNYETIFRISTTRFKKWYCKRR